MRLMMNWRTCEECWREAIESSRQNFGRTERMILPPRTCHACHSSLDLERSSGLCPACLISDALDDMLPGEPLGSFGGHELLEVIASGGMGIVYRARQREPRRDVALKTLHGAELRSPEARARFRHETRALGEIQHPAILPLHQCGEEDGVPFFTMQLAGGGSLAERAGGYARRWHEIARLLVTVSEGVHHAHERGILHRDLKPANLLFDEEGRVYVSDFGLARFSSDAESSLTLARDVLGTPHYLAPEVVSGGARAATTASDIWSLGVILHELLAQQRPFEGKGVAAVLRAIAESVPPPPSKAQPGVPRDLEIIVAKAMAPLPERRYASARGLAEDLHRWVDGKPIRARPTRAPERLWLWSRRNPAIAGLSAALLLALLGSAGWLAAAYQEVRESGRVLRENLYAADVNLAQRASGEGDPGRAAALLEAWRPRAGEPDLREFAWHYLSGQMESDVHRVWEGHDALISGFAIAPDGARVYSCSQDGVVRAWDFARGQPAGSWRVPGGFLMDLEVLPDGRLLLSSRHGGRLLNPATGVIEVLGSAGTYCARGTPDERVVLLGGRGSIFQSDDIVTIHPLDGGRDWALTESGGHAAFSRDGRLLATGVWHDAIKLWSWPEAELVGELRPSGTVLALAFTPDGALLAAAERNGHVVLWNVATGMVQARLTAHAPHAAWSVAFSPDGARLVTSGSDQTVRLWDTHEGTLLHSFRGHTSEVWKAAFTPDGQQIISASKDETLRVWQARPAVPAGPPAQLSITSAPVFSPDGELLAAACESGGIAVFETATWREIRRCGNEEVPLAIMEGSPKLLTVLPGRALRCWRIADGALDHETTLEEVAAPPQQALLSPDARWLAGFGEDRETIIWNTATGRIAARMSDQANRTIAAAFSPRGRWLATGNSDLTARLWEISPTGMFTPRSVLRGHKLSVSDVAFSGDDSLLATSSWDDSVRLWSVADGRQKHVFSGHFTGANAVAFIASRPNLVTLAGNGAVKFWDLRSYRLLLDLPTGMSGPTGGLIPAPGGSMLVAIGQDGALRVWNAPPERSLPSGM